MSGKCRPPPTACARCKGPLTPAPPPPRGAVCALCRPARDALVLQWLGLPGRVVWDHRGRLPYARDFPADAEGACLVGLVRCAGMFDPTRGIKFVTLAYKYCACELLLAARREGPLVGVPDNLFWRGGRARARADHQRAALRALRGAGRLPHSLPARGAPADAAGEVAALLARLPPREREALAAHFLRGVTLKELGRRAGVSGERARQVVAAGLARLRKIAGREGVEI